jgi:hypothetical protein
MTSAEYGDIVDFLKIVTLTTHQQLLCILRTVTKQQCAIIRQVAYNLMFNSSLDLKAEDKNYLKRNSSVIKQLASRKVCLQRKKSILEHKHLLVKRIATIVLKYLT